MPSSWMVTEAMRVEHFDYHGYMVKNREILKWYKARYSSQAKSKREKKR